MNDEEKKLDANFLNFNNFNKISKDTIKKLKSANLNSLLGRSIAKKNLQQQFGEDLHSCEQNCA